MHAKFQTLVSRSIAPGLPHRAPPSLGA